MNYLLDTNICIYIIKKHPKAVIQKLEKVMSESPNRVVLSSITKSELYYGAYKSAYPQKNMEALAKFMAPFESIDFDSATAKTYGKIRHELSREGNIIGPYDMQIAAIALVNDCTLVTNNTKEFCRIDGLALENWVKEKI